MTRDPNEIYIQRIVRHGKPYYRLLPYYAKAPTPAQMEVRRRFGELSTQATGLKMGPDRVPPSPKLTATIRGFRSRFTKPPPKPMWQQELEARAAEKIATMKPEEQETAVQRLIQLVRTARGE